MLHLIDILLQLTALILGLLHAVSQFLNQDADVVFLPERYLSVSSPSLKQALLSLLLKPFLQNKLKFEIIIYGKIN